jgi:hypothetical protein
VELSAIKDTLNVFLIVNLEGYRKSAARLFLKAVPPVAKISMIPLIKIPNIPSKYSYELIVSEQKNNLNFSMYRNATDIKKISSGS